MAISEDLRRRIEASPDADTLKRARQAIGASNRVASGRKFQDELDDTHKNMRQRGWGAVYPHASETVGRPLGKGQVGEGRGLRFKGGGNPVDYTGHVNLMYLPNDRSWLPSPWNPPPPSNDAVRRVRIPVVFDAKRMATGLQYRHEPKLLHQLLQLREADTTGAAAFLLIHHVAFACAYLVGPHHLATLIQNKPLQLVEPKSHQPLHPLCTYQLGFGWRYAEHIPAACLNLRLL